MKKSIVMAVLISVVLNILVPVAALAQAISGVVTDASHKPLPGAKVVIKDMKGATFGATFTDQSGRFTLGGVPVSNDLYRLEAVWGDKVSSPQPIKVDRSLTLQKPIEVK